MEIVRLALGDPASRIAFARLVMGGATAPADVVRLNVIDETPAEPPAGEPCPTFGAAAE